jgi:tetratricopeptide (TPR) repeat protein
VARKGLTRKELTEKDDITSVLELATTWAVDHYKQIGAGAAVVLVVIVAYVGWNFVSARAEAAAGEALAAVIQTYSDTAAIPDDAARYNATIGEAERVLSEHGGTQAADISRYYMALSQDGLGNAAESDQLLRELIDSGDPTIRDTARLALAESFKKRGDIDAAITEYEFLATAPDYSRGAVLYELGRLYEAAGMRDQAQESYEALVAEYPESPFRSDVDRALRRLRTDSPS